MDGIAGKVAVVAGGATGIGAATAARLGKEGARVVVGDLSEDGARATAARISGAGGIALPVTFDIADELAVAALFEAAVDAYGGVDLLYNVAADMTERGLRGDTDVLTVDLAVWDRTMTVDLRGYLLTIRHAIPLMLARGGGAIVNTSSGAAFVGEAERVCYAVAKSGITALTRHVASGWGKRGIRCNAIAPGLVLTETVRNGPHFADMERTILEVTRSPRLGDPADVAGMVAFLFSDDGAWINGQVIAVDGGNTMR
jgi:NAD(P)-dependent dehydrogenase (short-subunit alcohol dehydrogenase family)